MGLFFYLYIICGYLSKLYICYDEPCEMSLKSLEALRKSLNFYEKYYSEINLDGLFGFLELKNILKSITPSSVNLKCPEKASEILKDLFQFNQILDKYNTLAEFSVKEQTPEYYRKIKKVINSYMKLDHKSRHLKFNSTNDIPQLNNEIYDENNGDGCFSDIVDRNCHVSDYCYKTFINTDIGKGYVATHQLLYLQLYLAEGCFLKNDSKINLEDLENKIENDCRVLFRENENLLSENRNISTRTLDLFMEKFFICGAKEQFKDFFNIPSFLLIVNHQNPKTGCFEKISWKEKINEEKIKSSANNTLIRIKRRSSLMAGECNSHTLGLGVSSLGAFLKDFSS